MHETIRALRLPSTSKLFSILLLTGSLFYILFGPIWLPGSLGEGDFRAYWSAAYLLSQSQNFADTTLLGDVQRSLTGWSGEFIMSTWNPPWLLVLLLPYTAVSFSRATWLWLMSNILFVFGGAVLAWQAFTQQRKRKYLFLLAPLASLLFLPTMVAFWMGQVNTLVFAGLAAFLFLESRRQPFLAGTSLTLTLVKPHLVYVTIPILLLNALYQRNWRLLGGLFFGMISLTGVMFALRPEFLSDYLNGVSDGRLLFWQTPTLGGALAYWFGWQWAKLMGIVVLPVTLLLWWFRFRSLKTPMLVSVTVLVSLFTAPFGWGYDAVVLLIPLLQILAWLTERQFSRVDELITTCLLLLLNGLAMTQRFYLTNEVELFWIPLAVIFTFWYTHWQRGKSLVEVAVTP